MNVRDAYPVFMLFNEPSIFSVNLENKVQTKKASATAVWDLRENKQGEASSPAAYSYNPLNDIPQVVAWN